MTSFTTCVLQILTTQPIQKRAAKFHNTNTEMRCKQHRPQLKYFQGTPVSDKPSWDVLIAQSLLLFNLFIYLFWCKTYRDYMFMTYNSVYNIQNVNNRFNISRILMRKEPSTEN